MVMQYRYQHVARCVFTKEAIPYIDMLTILRTTIACYHYDHYENRDSVKLREFMGRHKNEVPL